MDRVTAYSKGIAVRDAIFVEHDDTSWFHCPHCGEEYHDRMFNNKNYYNGQLKSTGDPGVYICPKCGKDFWYQ